MVRTANALFAAGPPDVCDPADPLGALEGRKGAKLLAFNPDDGKKVFESNLDAPPVFDGMIAAGGRLLVALEDGSLVCLEGKP
jgi:outer membrane protein assembly factor BamB